MDETTRIRDIDINSNQVRKDREKNKVQPVSGFEVKHFGVTVEFGATYPNATSDIRTGVEVYKLDGDKKWKI